MLSFQLGYLFLNLIFDGFYSTLKQVVLVANIHRLTAHGVKSILKFSWLLKVQKWFQVGKDLRVIFYHFQL